MIIQEKKTFTIVVTYNGQEWIDKCLSSLQASTIPLEIIIVDNCSKDDTPEIIRNKFPSVQFIQNTDNLGFGKANNIGIRKAYDAGAEYIFLLNQDAWVEPATIEKLIKAQLKEPEYGIVSPVHLNGNGDALDYYFSLYIVPQLCPKLYSDKWLGELKDKIYEVDFVNAAAWLLSRKTLERVGGFSPLFFLYGEDNNYLDRIRYHRLKVGIYPHVNIFHDRFQREPNQYFTSNEEVEIRGLLTKYSDPGCSENIFSFLSKQQKLLIKKLIMLQFKDAMHIYRIYNKVNRKYCKIVETKRLTATLGMHFL